MKDLACELWPDDPRSARLLQKALSHKVSIRKLTKTPRLIAGVDACFTENAVVAVASLFAYPGRIHVEDAVVQERLRFPYIPGLLTFREGPAFIKALKALKTDPDVVIVDGQGIAHPAGIGIASHIGVLLDIPTIGCAKSRLIGDFQEPGRAKGSWSPLSYQGRLVGAVLRTRENVRPVFVSPGHRIDLKGSVDAVMRAVSTCRLPDPIRRADHLSRLEADKK
jgi:deoxyribonuclease V